MGKLNPEIEFPAPNGNSNIIDLSEKSSQDENSQVIPPLQAYFALWKYSSNLDVFLRTIGAIAGLCSGTALPIMTIVFGSLVNRFNEVAMGEITKDAFRKDLNKFVLYFVYLFIGKFSLVYFSAFLYSFTAARIARRIRLEYLENVLRQPIAYFDLHTPGSITTKLTTDTNVIEVGLGEKVSSLFGAMGMIISAFGVAFSKSWKMTLVVATMLPYVTLVTGVLSSIDTRIEKRTREVLDKASGIAEEALSSVVNVLALGAREKVVERFRGPVAEAMRLGKRRGPVQASMYGNMFFTMQSVYALTLFYGVKLYARGEIKNGGTVMVVLFSMIIASSSFAMLAPTIPVLIKASASAQQLLHLLLQTAISNETSSKSSNIKPLVLEGHIVIENLSFCYAARPTVKVLDNVSFEVAKGKVTAIVGHSGSGKSTLVGMLERWYDPSEGKVIVDGVEVGELDLGWWRGRIGLVQQEPMLFNDTIFQNVLNGYHGGNTEGLTEIDKKNLVVEACKQANAHDFISLLPLGYETNVGEQASTLSGGQKQRIAIARAIISNPKILLLDEATSALDSESENAVQAALEKASHGRTTIMIAHKMSTVEKADKIIVMDAGRVVEEGTHSSLLQKGGLYYRLLQSQTEISKSSENSSSATFPQSLTKQESAKQEAKDEVEHLPLDSPEVSNIHSLPHAILKMLTGNPSTIPSFVIGTAICFIAAGCVPIQAFLFSKLVTVFQLSGAHLVSRANFWALMFFILGLSNLASYFFLWFFFAISAGKLSNVYRPKYLNAMLAQPLSFFGIQGNTSGALTTLLASDGDDMEMLIGMNIGLLFVFAINLTSCCILALCVGWKLALVSIFACLPFLLASGFIKMRMDLRAQERCARFFLESARFGGEAVVGIRTVVSLGMEGRVGAEYRKRLGEAVVNSRRRLGGTMVFYAGSEAIDLLAAGLAFWYGGRLVSYSEISSQQYFLIYMAIILGGQSAGFIFGYTSSINKAHAATNRILYLQPPISSLPATHPTSQIPPPEKSTQHLLTIRNLSFAYPSRPNTQVLKNISLTLSPSENLVLTGPSGCGKSSLLSLIEGFWRLFRGTIVFSSKTLTNVPEDEWRKDIALVTQESWLVQGTLWENLLLGTSLVAGGLNREEEEGVKEVCREIGMGEWIESLPDGYATDVGNRGGRLSGGQRQRVCIARAILRLLCPQSPQNPGFHEKEKRRRGEGKLLLLDEATSALDRESEKDVLGAIERLCKVEGVAVMHVSHQEEVIRGADRVLVFDKGEVAEEYRGGGFGKGGFLG